MSHLFSPFELGSVTLENRVIVAPMCQYSADEGSATDWHVIHLGNMAQSGASLVLLEATAVEPQGRITAADLGLWSDANEQALSRVLESVRRHGTAKLGVQLGHAGRKASSSVPWKGGAQVPPGQANGWLCDAPSALPQADGEVPPHAMTLEDLRRVRQAFVASALRAVRLGLEVIELHGAHGYLLHQFLSPIANQRGDSYGGSLENRMRFPIEVFEAVRQAVPASVPVGIRLSAMDWVPGGWDIDQSVVLLQHLEKLGCAFAHVSSGGVSPAQQIPIGPGYQVPLAQRVKAETPLPTIAVGLITEAQQAEGILRDGQADLIALARGVLWNPRWAWQAAAELGGHVRAPSQYLRSLPHGAPKDLFVNAAHGQR